MRYITTLISLFLTSLLSSCAAASPNSVGSNGKISDSANSDVKLSIAVVEGGSLRPTGVIHIIIENTSDKPQAYYDEWNSWGYFNLTLEWTDTHGHSGTVSKAGGMEWTRNFPSTTILQPGEALVREISFDPKIWKGWPVLTDNTNFTLKAIYDSTSDEPVRPSEANGYGHGWIGSVTSKQQTVIIEPPPAP